MVELVEYFRLFCFVFTVLFYIGFGFCLFFFEYTQFLKSQLSFMSKN